MRVDISEKERVDAARTAAVNGSTGSSTGSTTTSSNVLGEVEIPYVPFYSLEECGRFDSSHSRTSLLPAVVGVVLDDGEGRDARALGRCGRSRSGAESLPATGAARRRCRKRQRTTSFFLSYARNDREETLDRFVDELALEVASLTGLRGSRSPSTTATGLSWARLDRAARPRDESELGGRRSHVSCVLQEQMGGQRAREPAKRGARILQATESFGSGLPHPLKGRILAPALCRLSSSLATHLLLELAGDMRATNHRARFHRAVELLVQLSPSSSRLRS